MLKYEHKNTVLGVGTIVQSLLSETAGPTETKTKERGIIRNVLLIA